MYNRLQLLNLIKSAKKLGFWDDVAHWEEELRKLDAK
jgi:hypothetical protein